MREPHLAEEITQAVFVILAQKAGRISIKVNLAGWLFKTTRFAAMAHIRAAVRRQRQEKELQMQTELQSELSTATSNPLWEQMSPLLDEAVATLGEKDRQAVLLRFFENKSLAEVGNSLGVGEDTARKRVSRALKKLHRYFNRHGVSSTTTVIAGEISANSVQTVPVALAKTVAAIALAKGATASASTLTLIKGALKIMAWTKAKTAIAIGVAAVLATGTTTVVIKEVATPALKDSDFLGVGSTSPPNLAVIRPTHFEQQDKQFLITASFKNASGKELTYMLGRDASAQEIIEAANGLLSGARVVFPSNMPTDQFDYLITMPDNPRAHLQHAIQTKLGYTAHWEVRNTNVLVLKVQTPYAPGLEISDPNTVHRYRNWKLYHYKIGIIIPTLEYYFNQPALDETGLTNFCDFDWSFVPTNDAQVKNNLENLGLELVSTNMPIEMLVVKKVK